MPENTTEERQSIKQPEEKEVTDSGSNTDA